MPQFDPNNPPDPAALAEMMRNAGFQPPPPPIPGMFPPGFAPPPIPGMMGGAPPFQIPGMGQLQGQGQEDGGGDPGVQTGSVRRRGPLPSQEESLQMEQQRGRYTRAR